MTSLTGKTIMMSGGSRGIGLAIALRAARDGANVVLLAKTDSPDPRLAGTIHSAVASIQEAGGNATGVVGDVRNDDDIAAAVKAAVDTYGGIDVVVNNASVLALTGTLELATKRYDLMQDVNVRGTFMLSRAALPHLLEASDPRILSLSPPLNLVSQDWLGRFPGYMMAKYGMTLATLGLGAEFASHGLTATTLWPRTTIATNAVGNLMGGEEVLRRSRKPEIMADAAHVILTAPTGQFAGRTVIDDVVLIEAGRTDLDDYANVPGTTEFDGDLFLD